MRTPSEGTHAKSRESTFRARKKNTLLISSVALALGGGVLVAVNVSANASNANSSPAGTITCPEVKLTNVPQQAKAEVQRNLDLLDKQIDEANQRLVSTQGQGGPNFVQNAILGPLSAKRKATIDRMATAIGRVAAPPTDLDSKKLATCTLTKAGQGTNGTDGSQGTATNGTDGGNGDNGDNGSTDGANGSQGTATNGDNGDNGDNATNAGTITCPEVKLTNVPQQAKAEVQRNLDLLDKQIDEANQRLVSTQGQGGPNFVQNAILGPLSAKRKATIDRMATAIGRVAAPPTDLDSKKLATCTLTKAGATTG